MMNKRQSEEVITRLRKIEGQIRGIVKMIENERYCIDILSQTRAVVSAMRKVEDMVMYQHLHTCVAESMKSGSKEDRNRKIDEVMQMFSQFKKGG
ncbi:MAG: metal-sensitive transcriptional regulator [Spirochaetales bacterium]|nr:metal-sensitive transcriptional regulator [Spirochaetales bacterium]